MWNALLPCVGIACAVYHLARSGSAAQAPAAFCSAWRKSSSGRLRAPGAVRRAAAAAAAARRKCGGVCLPALHVVTICAAFSREGAGGGGCAGHATATRCCLWRVAVGDPALALFALSLPLHTAPQCSCVAPLAWGLERGGGASLQGGAPSMLCTLHAHAERQPEQQHASSSGAAAAASALLERPPRSHAFSVVIPVLYGSACSAQRTLVTPTTPI